MTRIASVRHKESCQITDWARPRGWVWSIKPSCPQNPTPLLLAAMYVQWLTFAAVRHRLGTMLFHHLWCIMNTYTTLGLEWHLSSKPPYTMSAVTQPYLIVNGVMRSLWWDWCVCPSCKLYSWTGSLAVICVMCVSYVRCDSDKLSLNCVYGTVHTTCAGFTHLLFAVQCQCTS